MGLRKIAAIPLYILGFVFIGLIAGYLTFKILSFSKTVSVPDLRGKTLIEANGLLNKQTLYLKVEGEEFDSVIPPGFIVRQDVPAGNKVKEQRGIKVFVSKGPRIVHIPELVGQTLQDAELSIARSGMRTAKVIRVHSDTVEKETIIAQRPTPDETGGTVAPQTPAQQRGLSLIVSSGKYDRLYSCPDFSGKTMEEALGVAEKLGVALEFTGSGDRIKSQKPKANAIIRMGESINLQLEGG